MSGRRWSDGLHQAVESKENLPIKDESQTLASVTYQNLFFSQYEIKIYFDLKMKNCGEISRLTKKNK